MVNEDFNLEEVARSVPLEDADPLTKEECRELAAVCMGEINRECDEGRRILKKVVTLQPWADAYIQMMQEKE